MGESSRVFYFFILSQFETLNYLEKKLARFLYIWEIPSVENEKRKQIESRDNVCREIPFAVSRIQRMQNAQHQRK